jgi:hypothetical protein
MLPHNIIYEINVLCQYTSTISYFYKAQLKIRKEDKYIITIKYVSTKELVLRKVNTETEAFIYLHKAMKLCIRSKIIYKSCSVCDTKVYFPSGCCLQCMTENLVPENWVNNYENEKNTEHMGLKMKWNLIQGTKNSVLNV